MCTRMLTVLPRSSHPLPRCMEEPASSYTWCLEEPVPSYTKVYGGASALLHQCRQEPAPSYNRCMEKPTPSYVWCMEEPRYARLMNAPHSHTPGGSKAIVCSNLIQFKCN